MIGPAARLALPALAIALTGCASILHGTTQEITVLSSPAGAQVSLDGGAAGRTPFNVRVRRKQSHQVRLEATGYRPFVANLARHASGWALATDLTLGFPVGIIIDASNGALYDLTPEVIAALLVPAGDTPSSRDSGLSGPEGAPQPAAGPWGHVVPVGSRIRARPSGRIGVAQGIVTGVRGDTLEMVTMPGLAPVRIPLDRLTRLELGVGRQTHGAIGAAIGLVAGGGLGWLIGWNHFSGPCSGPLGACLFSPETRTQAGVLGATLGGLGGFAIGAVIGLAVTTERWQLLPASGVHFGVAPLPAGGLGLGAALAF